MANEITTKLDGYEVVAVEFDLSTSVELVPVEEAVRFHDEGTFRAGAWVSRALLRDDDGREYMTYAKSWQIGDRLSMIGLGAYGNTVIFSRR